MLQPLIALRHDQDWDGALVILAVAIAFAAVTAVHTWIVGGLDALDALLERDYDDRIQQPSPPKPAGGDR